MMRERLVANFGTCHTGYRISEALDMHDERIDFAAGAITFQ